MQYTIRCKGRVLGTTTLDFYHLIHGQHSGWLHPEPDADDLLNAISIGSAWIRAWLMRGDTLNDGRRLTQPEFETSRECEAISAAVAARSHLVLTLHREDGSELPTREIILQDRIYWDTPGIDDEDPYEGLDDQKRAELEASVEHDLAVISEWNQEEYGESTTSIMDDDEWRKLLETRWRDAEESRYQVHLRLANPDDLPSHLAWLTENAE